MDNENNLQLKPKEKIFNRKIFSFCLINNFTASSYFVGNFDMLQMKIRILDREIFVIFG